MQNNGPRVQELTVELLNSYPSQDPQFSQLLLVFLTCRDGVSMIIHHFEELSDQIRLLPLCTLLVTAFL
ncbi:unnamed protein product [Camellia sinensis]